MLIILYINKTKNNHVLLLFLVVKINLIVLHHISTSDIFKISQQNLKLMIMYILVFIQPIGRMLNNLSSIFDMFFLSNCSKSAH